MVPHKGTPIFYFETPSFKRHHNGDLVPLGLGALGGKVHLDTNSGSEGPNWRGNQHRGFAQTYRIDHHLLHG